MKSQPEKLAIIVTGPSGVGKGTVVRSLLSDSSLGIVRVLRHTSRNPRSGEEDGKANRFVSPDRFLLLAAENAFLEWNQAGSHFYGTTVNSYWSALAESQRIIFDVGVPSALRIGSALRAYNIRMLTVFLSPVEKKLLSSREGVIAAVEILENRIRRRSVIGAEEVLDRLRECEDNLGQAYLFEHIVVCKEFLADEATSSVKVLILNNGQVP